MHLFRRQKDVALARLNKLIEPRAQLQQIEQTQVLINPPRVSIKPIFQLTIAALVILFGFWWLTRPAQITQVQELSNLTESGQPVSSQIVVHVVGDVASPGIVHLPMGSRVIDAINAAGGFTPNAKQDTLNLAARIEDGQLIDVGADSISASDNRINLNTATLEQLDSLPGIGQVMANRILEWRTKHQRFSSVNELQEVEGIGPKLFSRIKDAVRI